jgi:glycosyltransferase involved in cell wall biosynthesis
MRILILHPVAAENRRYGTEIVAQNLAEEWAAAGHAVVLCGHGSNVAPMSTETVRGVQMVTLPPIASVTKWTEFRMRTDDAPGFAETLDAHRPELAIIAGLAPAIANLRHLEMLRERSITCGLWHHVPGVTCLQKGLRYKNRVPCDGRVDLVRCTRCRLTAAGVPERVADLASWFELHGLERFLPRGLDHVIVGRAMTKEFAEFVRRLDAHVDVSFVGAEWVRKVLLVNGFDPARIALVRPGLRLALAEALRHAPAPARPADDRLRLIYWGRLDDTKGVDTAISAVRQLTGRNLNLDIAASYEPRVPYHRALLQQAAGDSRITFRGHLSTPELAEALRKADLALIPSPWLETGPLTVFEARAAGLPILGARTGGIAELCGEDPSARLFDRGDAAELAAIIDQLQGDRRLLNRMRAMVPPARTMAQVAVEVLEAVRSESKRQDAQRVDCECGQRLST